MVTKKSIARFEDYVKEIERLRPEEQLNLIQIISARLKTNLKGKRMNHSLLELEGLGAQLWKGIDGQHYVNGERKSWD